MNKLGEMHVSLALVISYLNHFCSDPPIASEIVPAPVLI